METIEAYTERQNQEQEIRASMDYRLANLIGLAMNDPKKFPKTVKSAYPFMRKNKRIGTWQESKAEFAARAAAHNRTIGGGVT